MFIHPDFQLNDVSFGSIEELLEYVKRSVPSVDTFFRSFFDTSDVVQIQTSGSTGKPKIIGLKKEHMLNSARATAEYFKLKPKMKVLLCMNPEYVAGKMMLVRAVSQGWHLEVVQPGLNPLKDLHRIYDFCAMVPLQVSNSIKNLDCVKKLIIGGGVVRPELLEQLQNVATHCFATYGMTETITHIAVKQLNHISSLKENVKQKSAYEVLPNVSISIDQRNCLKIDAPAVSDEVVITNDMVKLISDSEFIWLGRYDNVINSGGVKLHPEQIEEKLAQIIEQRFFVTGIPDEVLGEKLILLIESETTSLHNDEKVMMDGIKNLTSLGKFEIPKQVYFLPKFVETQTKKIQRNKTLDLISL